MLTKLCILHNQLLNILYSNNIVDRKVWMKYVLNVNTHKRANSKEHMKEVW